METYRKYYNDELLVKELEFLQEKKDELREIINSVSNPEPYVVELAGLPRTGKTVTVERITDFFKFGKINVVKTTEPAQIIKDTHTPEQLANMSRVEFNDKTLEISKRELERLKNDPKNTIIIQDRGVIDNYFWYQMMYEDGTISEEQFKEILKSLPIDLQMMDKLYVMTALPEEIITRDYRNSIYLEPRKKTTLENVTKLKQGLESLLSNVDDERIIKIDTTYYPELRTATTIADNIMDGIKDKIYTKK